MFNTTAPAPPVVGQVRIYTAFGGVSREVRITAVFDDIKNGRPGFDGCIVGTSQMVWGYNDQITW